MSFHPSDSESDHEKKHEEEADGYPLIRRASKEVAPLSKHITNQCPVLQEFYVKDFADQACVKQTADLSIALGENVTIIRKGVVDIITDGFKCILCTGVGVPKRCVGQGNILLGLVATFAAWIKKNVGG